jgi:hypothetical protein
VRMEENREKKKIHFNAFACAIHIIMPIYLSPTPPTIFACDETVGLGALPHPARLVI